MRDRITRKHCERKLEQLAKALGTHTRKSFGDVGSLFIDSYQGLRIAEIGNDRGGESTPLGSGRHTARELYNMMSFALDALYLIERRGKDEKAT